MSRGKKNGMSAVHLWAARTGCPKPVYRTTRVTKVDPVILEEQKREQAQKELEQLFLSRAEPEAA